MSESEYTGPFCGSELFPTSRRKLSMRPCSSSWSRIVGMLLSTFVLRRFDQNPSSIVTARTGTECNFAYGEFARFRTPWSCQGSCVESTPPAADFPSANASAGFVTYDAAAVAAAASMNLRRETGLEVVMDRPPCETNFVPNSKSRRAIFQTQVFLRISGIGIILH